MLGPGEVVNRESFFTYSIDVIGSERKQIRCAAEIEEVAKEE